MTPFRFDALHPLKQDLNRRLQKPARLAGPPMVAQIGSRSEMNITA
jgi:hypothetical protein